jgi:hypothetical protein
VYYYMYGLRHGQADMRGRIGVKKGQCSGEALRGGALR